jgi:hypothetical protein
MAWQSKWKTKCHNFSLRLTTKAKGLQGCGPKGSPGVAPHPLGNVKKCEGMNPCTPTWEMKTKWTPESSKGDCMGENSMAWNVPYIIKKFLECRCLKWACIARLDIWNINYGQKKGRKSNWQFDSLPLKVGSQSDLLIYRWHVTYHWKVVDEGYNFTFDLISIGGLLAKLWCPKIAGVPIPYSSDVFYLRFTFESFKELKVHHEYHKYTHVKTKVKIIMFNHLFFTYMITLIEKSNEFNNTLTWIVVVALTLLCISKIPIMIWMGSLAPMKI